MMSAVSVKPSAIREATFSATWFGLEQKGKKELSDGSHKFQLKAAGNELGEM